MTGIGASLTPYYRDKEESSNLLQRQVIRNGELYVMVSYT